MKNLSIIIKIAAVLWIIWGAVHILAGVMTMRFIGSNDIAGAVGGIADLVPPDSLQIDFPDNMPMIETPIISYTIHQMTLAPTTYCRLAQYVIPCAPNSTYRSFYPPL